MLPPLPAVEPPVEPPAPVDPAIEEEPPAPEPDPAEPPAPVPTPVVLPPPPEATLLPAVPVEPPAPLELCVVSDPEHAQATEPAKTASAVKRRKFFMARRSAKFIPLDYALPTPRNLAGCRAETCHGCPT